MTSKEKLVLLHEDKEPDTNGTVLNKLSIVFAVLDMARHVPLYRALLELLRGLAVCPALVPLLLPLDKEDDSVASIGSLLDKMKACVDTYANRLKYVLDRCAKPHQANDNSTQKTTLSPFFHTFIV